MPMKDIDYKGKPVVCCVACKEFMMDDVIQMEQAGIPVYSTSEMAAEVIGEMYRYEQRRQKALLKALDACLADKSFTIDKPVRFRVLRAGDMDLWTEFVNGCSQGVALAPLPDLLSAPPLKERSGSVISTPRRKLPSSRKRREGSRRKVIGIARLIKYRAIMKRSSL